MAGTGEGANLVSTPLSKLAYADCYELLDRAMESERGIQRLFVDKGEAMNYRMRLQKARDEDRKQSRLVYQPGDPLYNTTEYAALTVRMPSLDHERQRWVVRIEKRLVGEMEIEEIPPPEILVEDLPDA
jgi:hypothetical protein